MPAADVHTKPAETTEEDDDSFLTEEERSAIAAQEDAFDQDDDERNMSKFSRGCLEIAVVFALLAVLLLLLEQSTGLCIGYELPQLFVMLCCVAVSLLALTTCLFSMLRKGIAAVVLIASLWFIVLLYCITNYQFPEVIPTRLPNTEQDVVLTQITTPIGVNLCIDDVLIPGVMSRRFKVPVHPRYMPLRYQVALEWSEEHGCVLLYYNDQFWAAYDPEKNRWSDALHSGIRLDTEETEETEETQNSSKTQKR